MNVADASTNTTPTTITTTTFPNEVSRQKSSRTLLLRLGDRIPFLGIYFAILSGFFFTASKLGTKLIPTVHPIVVVSIRSYFSAIIYFVYIAYKKQSFYTDNRRTNYLLIIRGFLGLCTCSLSYAALITVPLGDSITILLCYAVYANVFARIILKEPLSPLNGIFIVITLAGVILIAHPPFLFAASAQHYDHGRIIGILLNIGASFSFAFSMIVMRTMHGKHVSLTIFYFGLITGTGSALVMALMKLTMDNSPTIKLPSTSHEICIMIIIGFVGTLAELFLTMSLQIERTGVVAVTRGLDILMAFTAQWLFLKHESIEMSSAMGGFVTLIGVMGNAYVKHRQDLQHEKEKNIEIVNVVSVVQVKK